ncbi:hypothetical protein BASU183_03145 [Bacillus subtilis]
MEYALFDNGETKIELLSRETMAEIVGKEKNRWKEKLNQNFCFSLR